MGNVTCYAPTQVAQAERLLLRPPLRPVAAVWHVAHLPLDQVDAMQPISPTTGARGPVVALDYLFGPSTPAALYSTDPPPSHPAFVVVHEAIGHVADVGDVQLDRGSYGGSDGSGYDAWELTANVPGRPLYVHITSNQGAALLIRIAAAVVARAIRCGAVSGGAVQTRRCVYAATGTSAPPLAVAIDGDIYVVRADGSARQRLTAYGRNSSPRISPHATLIAYLSLPRGVTPSENQPGTHNVWIVPTDGRPDGSSAYRLTATDLHADRGSLAWSPDGHHLAFYHGASIVVCAIPQRTCAPAYRLRASDPNPFAGTAFAWAPDSHRLAVALPPPLAPAPGTPATSPAVLRVAVIRPGIGTTVATIRFPFAAAATVTPDGAALAWMPNGHYLLQPIRKVGGPGTVCARGGWTATQDTPARSVGAVLSPRSPLRSHHDHFSDRLLVETRVGGTHPQLAGVWDVSAGGGTPHLLLGTASGTAVDPTRYPAIADATHFLLSPDGRLLATDPSGRFWVAHTDGSGGRLVSTSNGQAGRVETLPTQFAWLPDSAGLAYVVATNGAGLPAGHVMLRLYGVALRGGAPRLLLSVTGHDEGALDLTQPFRCVDCAG